MKFDSFTIGQVFETNSFKLTKEDIMRFAGEFDPQYMHVDEKKATEGRFNGIIASGIHTLSISFKLWIEQGVYGDEDRKSTRLNSSHVAISYAVFCLKKKKRTSTTSRYAGETTLQGWR